MQIEERSETQRRVLEETTADDIRELREGLLATLIANNIDPDDDGTMRRHVAAEIQWLKLFAGVEILTVEPYHLELLVRSFLRNKGVLS